MCFTVLYRMLASLTHLWNFFLSMLILFRSTSFHNFVKVSLTKNPKKRPTAEKLLTVWECTLILTAIDYFPLLCTNKLRKPKTTIVNNLSWHYHVSQHFWVSDVYLFVGCWGVVLCIVLSVSHLFVFFCVAYVCGSIRLESQTCSWAAG